MRIGLCSGLFFRVSARVRIRSRVRVRVRVRVIVRIGIRVRVRVRVLGIMLRKAGNIRIFMRRRQHSPAKTPQ